MKKVKTILTSLLLLVCVGVMSACGYVKPQLETDVKLDMGNDGYAASSMTEMDTDLSQVGFSDKGYHITQKMSAPNYTQEVNTYSRTDEDGKIDEFIGSYVESIKAKDGSVVMVSMNNYVKEGNLYLEFVSKGQRTNNGKKVDLKKRFNYQTAFDGDVSMSSDITHDYVLTYDGESGYMVFNSTNLVFFMLFEDDLSVVKKVNGSTTRYKVALKKAVSMGGASFENYECNMIVTNNIVVGFEANTTTKMGDIVQTISIAGEEFTGQFEYPDDLVKFSREKVALSDVNSMYDAVSQSYSKDYPGILDDGFGDGDDWGDGDLGDGDLGDDDLDIDSSFDLDAFLEEIYDESTQEMKVAVDTNKTYNLTIKTIEGEESVAYNGSVTYVEDEECDIVIDKIATQSVFTYKNSGDLYTKTTSVVILDDTIHIKIKAKGNIGSASIDKEYTFQISESEVDNASTEVSMFILGSVLDETIIYDYEYLLSTLMSCINDTIEQEMAYSCEKWNKTLGQNNYVYEASVEDYYELELETLNGNIVSYKNETENEDENGVSNINILFTVADNQFNVTPPTGYSTTLPDMTEMYNFEELFAE